MNQIEINDKTKDVELTKVWYRAAVRMAVVAGVFSLIICGLLGDKHFKAVQVGGPSGRLVVLDDSDCMVALYAPSIAQPKPLPWRHTRSMKLIWTNVFAVELARKFVQLMQL